MARLVLVLLSTAGCYDSHLLGVGLDGDSGLDAGPRDFGTRRDFGRPGRDLGPRPDGGSTCGLCTSETIRWRPDGGFTFERSRWELSPCDRLLEQVTFADDTEPTTCTGALGDFDCDALARIEALKETAPVRMLRDAAPVVLGRDTRPVDGQIQIVWIGGDQIGVGGDCDTDPDCVPVPPEMRELVDLLGRVSDDLGEPGVCEPVPEADTFVCGEGPREVSCVSGREVCYLDRFDHPRCAIPSATEDMCEGPPACDCLLVSLAESCTELVPGEVTIRWVGP